jgi:predicted DCC family thiol-disulfide oxidoreductase YuxK
MTASEVNTSEHPVLLFDGVCNLCNSSVQFIIDKDPDSKFHFASLQSDIGQALLDQFDANSGSLDSVVLIKNDKVYTRSSAALQTLKTLGGGWALFYAFIIIPKPVRDFVYDWIARNRYKWFGKKDACWLPTPDLKARFLDN